MAVLNVSYSVASGTTTVRGGQGGGVAAPSIVTQPQSQSVIAGGPVTFTVVAAGDAPLTYQWKKNGADIGGATGSSYSITVADVVDNGAVFTVVVSGPGGSPATSAGATLTVTANAAPVDAGVIIFKSLAGARTGVNKILCCDASWPYSSTYERRQLQLTFDFQQSATHTMRWYSRALLGADANLAATNYTLRIKNAALQTLYSTTADRRVGNLRQVDFTIDITSIPTDGYYIVEVEPTTTTTNEISLSLPVAIKKNATWVQPSLMPSWPESWDIVTSKRDWTVAMVPAVFNPGTLPRPARTFLEDSRNLLRTDLFCELLVFGSDEYVRRPALRTNGILTTANPQSYHISNQFAKIPRTHVIDGPRGKGCIQMITHAQPAQAVINGVVRNTNYVCTPWSLVKIDSAGTITTLAGYRWKDIATYHEDVPTEAVPANPSNPPGTLELVGNWDAVPSTRRGFWSIWGFAWDERTTPIDTAAPFQDTPEGPEQPHAGDVVGFVADTRNNRIIKLAFNGQDRTAPVVVSEFIYWGNYPGQTYGPDPWDVVYVDGKLYVSLRREHRIAEYDATTGAFIRNVVLGQSLGTVDESSRTSSLFPGVTLAQAQAADAVVPEGLFYQDGWLYYSSKVTRQVKKVNLTTGQILTHIASLGSSTSGEDYSKIALSDGTFMPRGTLFYWGWFHVLSGWPRVFTPAGVEYLGLTNDAYSDRIRGAHPATGKELYGMTAYASGGGVGNGRLICGPSKDGLYELSIKRPDDPAPLPYAAITAGDLEWKGSKGLWLTHQGSSWYGLPQPWGESDNIDTLLHMVGWPVPVTTVLIQPANVTRPVGDQASFSTNVYGAGLRYVPQVSTDSGTTWTDVSTSSPNRVYVTPPVTAAMNGWQYRFAVTGTNGNVNTATATLTIA